MASKAPLETPPPPASPDDVEYELPPLIRVFKNGSVERLLGTDTIAAGTDPATGVRSKDVIFSPEDGFGVRVYLPKDAKPESKLPLVVYYHGGGFCIESAWSPRYHAYVNRLASEANVVVVSVNYRLAPEHPVPAALEDSWAGLKWVASHFNFKSGSAEPEPTELWLSEYADYNRVFLTGDSAGGTIVHYVAVRAGEEGLPGAMRIDGIIVIQPFFSGVELIGNEAEFPASMAMAEKVWKLVYPGMAGLDDPVINPFKYLDQARKVECQRVQVWVAGKDTLAARAAEYGDVMKRCGKEGLKVDVLWSEGMDHVFHLIDPDCEEAKKMMNKVVDFIKWNPTFIKQENISFD